LLSPPSFSSIALCFALFRPLFCFSEAFVFLLWDLYSRHEKEYMWSCHRLGVFVWRNVCFWRWAWDLVIWGMDGMAWCWGFNNRRLSGFFRLLLIKRTLANVCFNISPISRIVGIPEVLLLWTRSVSVSSSCEAYTLCVL